MKDEHWYMADRIDSFDHCCSQHSALVGAQESREISLEFFIRHHIGFDEFQFLLIELNLPDLLSGSGAIS